MNLFDGQPIGPAHESHATADDKSGKCLRLRAVRVSVAQRELLQASDVEIPTGKITIIVGGSGAGKSVLLRILSGLIQQDDPVVRWSGTITDDSGRPLQRVGIVFQQFALFDELSPIENVQFAIDHRRDPASIPEQSAVKWLHELGVPWRTPVAGLSGGQRQRLAIARTLAADPQVILYDEPTSGLDAASGRQVAELISRTQLSHRRTSVVVTHDYETLLPIADHVLLFDSHDKRLVPIEREQWSSIATRMQPVALPDNLPDGTLSPDVATEHAPSAGSSGSSQRANSAAAAQHMTRIGELLKDKSLVFFEASGEALLTAARFPWHAAPRWPQARWGLRFTWHYLRLVAGPSAWIYLLMAGIIIGFASTHFTFRYLPFSLYTKPLLIEDLLAAIGFALYRILVPLLATILVAARCGAAVAADVGVRRYGSQIEALQTLGVRPAAYLLSPIVIAFVIGTPALEWIGFQAAQWVSMVTFLYSHPEAGPPFWDVHFHRQLHLDGHIPPLDTCWVLAKNLACGLGIAAIAYYRGLRPKPSARDVSESITATVLWTTLFVLVVHFIAAFAEF